MIKTKKKKRDRIKIGSIKDLENIGYTIEKLKENNGFTEEFEKVMEKDFLKDVIYKVHNVDEFIQYIKDIVIFEDEYKKLVCKLNKIDKLSVKRNEYERKFSEKENVEDILFKIDEIRKSNKRLKSNEEIKIIEEASREIDENYIYSKDIELLKKMVGKNNFKKNYNSEEEISEINLLLSGNLNFDYIKSDRGSVEYYNALRNDIPKMRRLRKNIYKFIENNEEGFTLNQSKTLGDSINIAIAKFNGREFKAVSGKNDVLNYCKVVNINEEEFKSKKVNKLGKLGEGYRRVNDSEKKIFEEIHKRIENLEILDEGNLVLYSKWEPCPSCLYVISQFKEKYPKINVDIRYYKKYGEK